jgi:uncharacterized membrane protein YphA (DoxX/SURF4 family)
MTTLASSAASSRGRTIAYWITTVLVAAESMLGGVWDIRQIPYVRADIDKLGYPAYVLSIIGVWKLLGAVAVLVPRFPRLKEWAYAGMFFNYTGAVASHLAVGDGVESVAYPIIITGLVVASWALRPSARRELAPSIPMRE